MKKLVTMLAVAAAGATMLAVALTGSVSAHAPYDTSTPAKGANLTTAPASVVINFQASIQHTAGSFGVTVAKDGGGSVTSGAATVSSDTQLTVPLQSGLTAGRYVVNWNNTAADDGDTLAGAFSFYVNTQPTAAQLAADQQLAAIEANALATATAQAATTPTAAPAVPTSAPAAVSTPRAATSPAAVAPSSRLPSSGSGREGSRYSTWLLAAALTVAASGVVAVGAGYRRSRGR